MCYRTTYWPKTRSYGVGGGDFIRWTIQCTQTCYKDCSRLLFIPMHTAFSSPCLFTRHVTNWAHVQFSWSASDSWSMFCSFKSITLDAHTSYIDFSSTNLQNIFFTLLRRIAALIAEGDGYNKCWFPTLIINTIIIIIIKISLLWKFRHLFVPIEVVWRLNFI